MEIRKGNKSVGKRYGFRSSGNINHVRYDHKQRAREIHVVCENCGHLAIAEDTFLKPEQILVGDMSRSWGGNPFSVNCMKCASFEEGLSYSELPEPYHRIYEKSDVLWAYNFGHLDMIETYLRGAYIEDHPYKFFYTYVHGSWKKNSDLWVKSIGEHLAETDEKHKFLHNYKGVRFDT